MITNDDQAGYEQYKYKRAQAKRFMELENRIVALERRVEELLRKIGDAEQVN